MPDSVSRRSVAAIRSPRLLPVKVKVRLFAGLRERAGGLDEIDATTVADVWPTLDLGSEPQGSPTP